MKEIVEQAVKSAVEPIAQELSSLRKEVDNLKNSKIPSKNSNFKKLSKMLEGKKTFMGIGALMGFNFLPEMIVGLEQWLVSAHPEWQMYVNGALGIYLWWSRTMTNKGK